MPADAPDELWMARAIALGRRGLWTTDPNPRVGCVLVRDGRNVGEGWHRRTGGEHAEVAAIGAAGELARGATAYVSLEPCCHHGRTGPCTEALIAAGITRVVAAARDPDARVDGGGLAVLEAAGIETCCGVLAADAEALNPGFLKRKRGRGPWVRVKVAATLDGRTATADGESRWITGPEARRDVHRLRARSSAVVTGAGTVAADDPRLTAREIGGAECVQPLRVVLDPELRTPPDAALLREPGATLVATCANHDPGRARALAAAGAEVCELPAADAGIDLPALLEHLAEREVNEVLVEAGATLSGAFLDGGHADELIVYLAPALLGDRARGLATLPSVTHLDRRIGLEPIEVRRLGRDLRMTFTPIPSGGAAGA